ncbi:MAG: hypothetical protein JXP36_15035 [Bacteroidales bacterium]|nr:hypothetical protein [Bacteroidales bacterium]
MKMQAVLFLILSFISLTHLFAAKSIEQIEFDLKKVPFSYFGSYMSLSTRNADNTLRLSDHTNGNKTIADILTFTNNEQFALDYKATPVIVIAKSEGKSMECLFENSNILRIRTDGLDLKLLFNSKAHNFIKIPGLSNTFKIRVHNYVFSVIQGGLELKQIDDNNLSVLVRKDAGDKIEIAIEQFVGDWNPRTYATPFDSCRSNSQAAIVEWDNKFVSAPSEFEESRKLASYLLWSNAYNPRGLIKRAGIGMSKNWMDNIWSWDNCFNAIALSYAHPNLALDQLHVILDHQDDSGCLPDYINSNKLSFNSKKPPIYGWTVLKMMENMEIPLLQKQILYEKIEKLTNYWFVYRDEDKNGIPHYYHGNDSGWDNSTSFLAGVPLESPDLLAFLSVQARLLSILAKDLDKQSESDFWEKESEKIKERLISNLWDGKRFFFRNANNHQQIDNGTSLMQFLPIILGEAIPKSVSKKMVEKVSNTSHFLTLHGLATENISSDYYESDGYWRGPIWAPSTAIIVDGLKRAQYTELAREVALRFSKLCNSNGFAENFDAVTGKPLRDPAYTWTASVYIMFLNEYFKNE